MKSTAKLELVIKKHSHYQLPKLYEVSVQTKSRLEVTIINDATIFARYDLMHDHLYGPKRAEVIESLKTSIACAAAARESYAKRDSEKPIVLPPPVVWVVKEEIKEEVKHEVKDEVKDEAKENSKKEINGELKQESKVVKGEVSAPVKEETKEEVKQEVVAEAKEEATKEIDQKIKQETAEGAKEETKQVVKGEIKAEVAQERKQVVKEEIKGEVSAPVKEEAKEEVKQEDKSTAVNVQAVKENKSNVKQEESNSAASNAKAEEALIEYTDEECLQIAYMVQYENLLKGVLTIAERDLFSLHHDFFTDYIEILKTLGKSNPRLEEINIKLRQWNAGDGVLRKEPYHKLSYIACRKEFGWLMQDIEGTFLAVKSSRTTPYEEELHGEDYDKAHAAVHAALVKLSQSACHATRDETGERIDLCYQLKNLIERDYLSVFPQDEAKADQKRIRELFTMNRELIWEFNAIGNKVKAEIDPNFKLEKGPVDPHKVPDSVIRAELRAEVKKYLIALAIWAVAMCIVAFFRGGRRGGLWLNTDALSVLGELDAMSNIPYAILFIMALSSLTVYSIILAGWASNSKYAFIGALRSAAQMISYEVSITLILLPIVLLSGSLNLTQVVFSQSATTWYVFPLLPIALIFLVAMLAETNRTPFDLPEAEAELVAGYNVDYSALPFAMFFLGEYSNMILMSVLFCLLFLGGWGLFGFSSVLALIFKSLFLWFFFIHVRATLPRYRYDQLMDIGWKAFLPAASGFFFFTVGLVVFFDVAPIVNELYLASTMLIPFSLLINQKLVCIEPHQTEVFLVDYTFNTIQLLPCWFTVTFFMFFTGLLGMMYNYRSFLITMMSVEVMYLGIAMSFVLYGVAFKDSDAAIYALLILIFAACESAIGLGLLIVLYRFGQSVTFDAHSSLHSSSGYIALTVLAHSTGPSFFSRNLFHLASSQYAQTYFGLVLYTFLALLLCGVLAALAYLLSLSTSQDTEKRSEYECGFAPFDSATRLPFDVHFYLVGILFLVFDVEVALIFPWTSALASLTWYAFFSMVGFVVVLTIGFIYEWKRGALIWPNRRRTEPSSYPTLAALPLVGSSLEGNSSEFTQLITSVQDMHNYAENLFGPLLPEMVLTSGILLIILSLAVDFARYSRSGKQKHTLIVYHAVRKLLLVVMAVIFISLLTDENEARFLLSGYLFTNSYTALLKLLVLGCSYIVLLAAREYIANPNQDVLEFSLVYALAVLFLLILVSANHLMTAFLALAGFSLNMYVLILFNARQHISREAGIKYYYLSTFSTGLILYGMFLIYAFARSGMFEEINAAFSTSQTSLFELRFVHFGLLLVFVGFMFKLSAFPGHLWAADVYEGSPVVVTAFFMLPAKIAILAFFLRFLTSALSGATAIWQPWLVVASAISMVWGAFAAVTAKNTLRFAAFTSINQMGFILIGPTCVTFEGYSATFTYLFIYALMSTVFLVILVSTRRDDGKPMRYLTDFRAFGQENWVLSWALVATLFSMAGIPPLVGFFGKYYLLISAMQSGQFVLAIIGLATSLVSTYYYLRLIKILWFEGADDAGYSIVTANGGSISGTSVAILFSEALQWAFIVISPTLLILSNQYTYALLSL